MYGLTLLFYNTHSSKDRHRFHFACRALQLMCILGPGFLFTCSLSQLLKYLLFHVTFSELFLTVCYFKSIMHINIIYCLTSQCILRYSPTVTELRRSFMPQLSLRDCCSHICCPDHKWWRTSPSLNFLPFAVPTLSYTILLVPHCRGNVGNNDQGDCVNLATQFWLFGERTEMYSAPP